MAGFENSSGLGVSSFYGPMTRKEGIEGEIRTEGSVRELVLEISGKSINANVADRDLAYLGDGAKVLEAIVEVREVFALSGTSPTIAIGTEGSEATNGFTISKAQAEATGVYKITSFNGTWANALAAATQVATALGGTGPSATDAGFARVVIRYYKLS